MKADAFPNLPDAVRWYPQQWDVAGKTGNYSGSVSLRTIVGVSAMKIPLAILIETRMQQLGIDRAAAHGRPIGAR